MREAANRKQRTGNSRFGLMLAILAAFGFVTPARAHVGSKDVFETVTAGPYKLFVTVRMPTVIPGVATIEVESSGAPLDSLEIAPTLLTGEASLHPPAPDAMTRSKDDPNAFTGSLWIMSSGSWEVRFAASGPQGSARANVPVPAVPLTVLHMQRPLGILLAVLGLILALGFAGLVAAAVRESRLPPGAAPTPERRRRASLAFVAGLAVAALGIWGGGKWWNVEAAGYADNVYKPSELKVTLLPQKDSGDLLALSLGATDKDSGEWTPLATDKLLLDHGKPMHLYAIRWPEMDAVYHLHPQRDPAQGALSETLPAMPAGTYKLFADIVRPSGFPETLTTTVSLGGPGPFSAPPSGDDASATPPPLSAGMLPSSYKLPDGYTLHWDAPANLVAAKAYSFHFTLLEPTGKPATDVAPYLGMAGHAAFVKTDATVFAHTHPDGSAAMPAMMLANGNTSADPAADAMESMPGMEAGSKPLPASVDFPYGFPAAGRYRIFIQMKHGSIVETGVFDADVH